MSYQLSTEAFLILVITRKFRIKKTLFHFWSWTSSLFWYINDTNSHLKRKFAYSTEENEYFPSMFYLALGSEFFVRRKTLPFSYSLLFVSSTKHQWTKAAEHNHFGTSVYLQARITTTSLVCQYYVLAIILPILL